MLGVKAALGRVFNSREDDQVFKGHPVVVLSHGYWVTRFGRDPLVIGKTIRVNDYPMTIVGVSAEGFAGLDPSRSPQLRVSVLMQPILIGCGQTGAVSWLNWLRKRPQRRRNRATRLLIARAKV
jgi:MacB-like periplasmic core domain